VRREEERRERKRKGAVAIVGAGRLASFLARALRESGYEITEIIARARPGSMRRARSLAKKVETRAVTAGNAALDADVIWFCVPDREIRAASEAAAARVLRSAGGKERSLERARVSYAFHSSGALLSDELGELREAGIGVASVHPLMSFVAGVRPSLRGVPFALEGDVAAIRVARRMVRELGAESFVLLAGRKSAYHAWATMTSPLLVAYLVTLEEAGRQAGLSRERARRMSLPIILQTLANYGRRGPANAFSGPFIRGDSETVAKHLALLQESPSIRAVYVALARVALARLPAGNRRELEKLLAE
jgi:predicted short-subunit dehydrogenase-like oxidoreductase (DUF2520 family)